VKRARVRVRGQVQGVYFRAETEGRARSLRVGGWVRNVADGSLEAVFEGDDESVDSMVAWSRHGPAGARVDEIELAWEEPQGETGFRVID
jgi:acylphosphatase